MQFIFKLPLLMSLIFNNQVLRNGLSYKVCHGQGRADMQCMVSVGCKYKYRYINIIRIGTPSWILLAERNMMLAS